MPAQRAEEQERRRAVSRKGHPPAVRERRAEDLRRNEAAIRHEILASAPSARVEDRVGRREAAQRQFATLRSYASRMSLKYGVIGKALPFAASSSGLMSVNSVSQ